MLHIAIVHAHNVSKHIPQEKIFHRVENVIKQLVHTSAVRSSRYEARGKFREHLRKLLECSPNFPNFLEMSWYEPRISVISQRKLVHAKQHFPATILTRRLGSAKSSLMEGVKEMKTTSKLWRPARKSATSASYLRNLASAWDTSPAIIMIQKPESAKISSMVNALVMKTTSKP